MDWIQPAAFIAGAVAIVGWFVASWLRLYETQRENRRSTYTKVLSPAANCIAQLRHACDSNRGAWSATQHAAFEKCYIELVAAEGEVDLIGKSKVSWSAAYLRKTLQDVRHLPDDGAPPGEEDTARFQEQVRDLYELSLEARDGFLLTARRSLEAWPVRRWRDRHETGRKEQVTRIGEQTRAEAARIRAAQARRSDANKARAGVDIPTQAP